MNGHDDLRLDGRLCLGTGLRDASVLVRGGRVVAVDADRARGSISVHRRPDTSRIEKLDAGSMLAPGFVDIHIHGGAGTDVMSGSAEIHRLASALAARGVTSFVPTAVSAPIEALARFVAEVDVARAEQDAPSSERGEGAGSSGDGRLEARILGANLEGPALDPAHLGAQDPSAIVDPAAFLAAWRSEPTRWSGVKIVTVAPERPGGLELVGQLAASGVAVSVGHTGATFAQAQAAYAAGASSTTHLFNAMTPLEHRAPGAVGAALLTQRASVELIADGIHVDPGIWPMLWRVLRSRLVLVSDAMSAAGLGDGAYRLGSVEVKVRGGRATTADGTLAGSTITVADAVANLVEAGLSVPRAVAAASIAPARLLGRRDIGRIAVGAVADFVVLDAGGRVQRTMIGGRWLDGRG